MSSLHLSKITLNTLLNYLDTVARFNYPGREQRKARLEGSEYKWIVVIMITIMVKLFRAALLPYRPISEVTSPHVTLRTLSVVFCAVPQLTEPAAPNENGFYSSRELKARASCWRVPRKYKIDAWWLTVIFISLVLPPVNATQMFCMFFVSEI